MPAVVREVPPDQLDEFIAVHGTAFGRRDKPEEIARTRGLLADAGVRRLGAFVDGVLAGVGIDFAIQLTLPGGAPCATGGVSWIGVLPTHRRRGALRALVAAHHAGLAERGFAATSLYAADSVLYRRFGYGAATQTATFEIATRHAALAAPADRGATRLVSIEQARRLLPAIWERARPQRVGFTDRLAMDWVWWLAALDAFVVIHEPHGGEPDGYAVYDIAREWTGPSAEHRADIEELIAVTPEAALSLWRHVLELDHVVCVRAANRPVDEPLRHALAAPRRLETRAVMDAVWLRLVDVGAMLAARRYAAPGALTLAVDGSALRLEVDDAGAAAVTPARAEDADLVLAGQDLAAAYLGGTSLASLAAALLVQERTPGAIRRADAMFAWTPAPWCPLEY